MAAANSDGGPRHITLEVSAGEPITTDLDYMLVPSLFGQARQGEAVCLTGKCAGRATHVTHTWLPRAG